MTCSVAGRFKTQLGVGDLGNGIDVAPERWEGWYSAQVVPPPHVRSSMASAAPAASRKCGEVSHYAVVPLMGSAAAAVHLSLVLFPAILRCLESQRGVLLAIAHRLNLLLLVKRRCGVFNIVTLHVTLRVVRRPLQGRRVPATVAHPPSSAPRGGGASRHQVQVLVVTTSVVVVQRR